MADRKKKTAPGDFAVNRKAFHDYAVLEKLECGIELSGTEVKVVRHGEASLSGAYAAVLGGQLCAWGDHLMDFASDYAASSEEFDRVAERLPAVAERTWQSAGEIAPEEIWDGVAAIAKRITE